ncbi:small ribosomal subunit biogenesis GTPase RsgA [Idiomarina xiamenensis]|uniref:Small ribosomal subunit biogenesis GTPase RsgA n=1 Tax=Idiomarina xiamenensis 10-D-4 TaxID=740709 RepID=K2KCW7_9GAMM|nr:small ribosomal subunit biogenesis GTPase RsgA [Idiomarina xiamenensis]EKE84537.1 GTPase RsgA [Idiomarina xiamenensis 10-D-4]
MAKRQKLNKGQQRRVRANHSKRLAKAGQPEPQLVADDWQQDQLGSAEAGVIVSRYGQHADVADQHGQLHRCHIRRTVESLVCGDKVIWRRAKEASEGPAGVIEAVNERHSLLSRPDYYDGIKPVAANIDQIFIVSSVLPSFSAQIIDRYLVACEDADIEPVIVLNKVDLLVDLEASERADIDAYLAAYEQLGYRVLRVSSRQQDGLSPLFNAMNNRVSVFVGQSGVGKSSLVNALLPDVEALTQQVSDNSGLGQHTTTVATRYALAAPFSSTAEAAIIDSPGIREFSLWHLDAERVAWCFIDFRPYLGRCKFRDCKHRDDPGCAIQQAVADNDIYAWRLANFHRIIDSMETQRPARADKKR